MSRLFIYLDESGNFDFTHKGTPFFLICAIVTPDPATTQQPLQELKYKLLADGIDISGFHASEDNQLTRDLVFQTIEEIGNISFHFAYVDKRNLADKYKNSELLYTILSRKLLDHCLALEIAAEAEKIIVIFDNLFNARARNKLKATLKSGLTSNRKPYHLYFHKVSIDFNAQIADYGAWSLYVKLSRNEVRPWKILRKFQPAILDIALI